MLQQCGLVIPNIKTKLVNRISKFKALVPKEDARQKFEADNDLDPKVRKLQNDFRDEEQKFNVEKRDPFFKDLKDALDIFNLKCKEQNEGLEKRKKDLFAKAWEIINSKPAYMSEPGYVPYYKDPAEKKDG